MSGSEGSNPGDGGLSANRFDIDGEIPGSDEDLHGDGVELGIDYSEQVARLWDTPEGAWWP
jgi:hypothetical protein